MFEWQFSSLNELFWMNGHGPYVWGSYALALLALVFLVWSPLAQRRQLLGQLRQSVQRERRQSQQSPANE
jgi:heme exporter protein D